MENENIENKAEIPSIHEEITLTEKQEMGITDTPSKNEEMTFTEKLESGMIPRENLEEVPIIEKPVGETISRKPLTQEDKEEINKKFSEIFSNLLDKYISKFTDDIETFEKMKYEFNDLYYEMEKIKEEISEHNNKDLDKSNYTNLTTKEGHEKNQSQSSNLKTSSNKNEQIRSKTPAKSKTNTGKPIETKNSNNDLNTSRLDTARNLVTEKSKTPIKNVKGKSTNAALNYTTNDNSKKHSIIGNLKDKNNDLSKSKVTKGTDNKLDTSRSNIKTMANGEKTASGKANNTKISGNTTTNSKRDMTPIVRKNKPSILDTSTISNLDTSMVGDNKGNQTNRNKNARVSQFSSKPIKEIEKDKEKEKETKNNESTKNTTAATNKKPATTTHGNNKKLANTKETSGAKGNNTNGKADKPNKKEDKINTKDKKEAVKSSENIEDSKTQEETNNVATLTKENSVTNIMDIIAEKNKEVNIEEVINQESNLNNERVIEKKEEKDITDEEGKVNKSEENKNGEISEVEKKIDVESIENEKVNEYNEISKESEADTKKEILTMSQIIPNYKNKKNKALHQLIISELLTPDENFKIIFTNKELLENKQMKLNLKTELKKDLKKQVGDFNEIINKYSNDPASQTLIDKLFVLSKTASGGLNMIKKDEEPNLFKKEFPPVITDLFRFLLLLYTDKFHNLSDDDLKADFFQKILPSLKLDSLKSLINHVTQKPSNYSLSHFNTIIQYVSLKPHIVNSNEYLSINRSISYITFTIKEVVDYLSVKLPDGNYAYCIKSASKKLKKYTEILEKLENELI